MIRCFLCILLLGAVCFTGCASRPKPLEEATTPTETEAVYVRPDKSYLEALAENLGYADSPDSLWCYQAPLVTEADFVEVADLAWDMDKPTPTRFLSYNYKYMVERKDSLGQAYIDMHPNTNYLTDADGTREKLCPYATCRTDAGELCTHIDLSSGVVLGDYVYFTGANLCIASPLHPNRSADNDAVNLLLRYSLESQTLEKLCDLPSMTYGLTVTYDVLAVTLRDPATQTLYTLLVDTDGRVARAGDAYGCKIPMGGRIWGVRDGVLCSADPARTAVTATDIPATSLVGVWADTLYFTRTEENESRTLYATDGKKVTLLLENLANVAVADGQIWYTIAERALHFTMTDLFGDEREVYRACTPFVYAADIGKGGTLGAASVVFDAAAHATYTTEAVHSIKAYGDSIRVQTIAPPDERAEDVLPYARYYVLRPTIREDGEEVLHSY